MINLLLNVAGFLLMAAIATHSVILHLRLRRFRQTLSEVGQVLPTLDASVDRMSAVASGFAQRLLADLEHVEDRIAAARRTSVELAAANRAAKETVVQLDRLQRQQRRAANANAPSMPRAMVEPKGFAERAGLPPATEVPQQADTAA